MKKTALVTGAAGDGIGRSCAYTLARDGFNVVVNYRSHVARAEAVCAFIRKNGGTAVPIQADVFKQDQCARLIDETLTHFNRIDACIIGPGADWNAEPVDEIDANKSLQDVVQEIEPIYFLLPRIIQEMRKPGSGRIIGFASNPQIPSPSYSYNVAKAARANALLEMVKPCWQDKITVNVIAPGPVMHFSTATAAQKALADFETSSEGISPQDIAEMVAFLCSAKGHYVTGNVIGHNF